MDMIERRRFIAELRAENDARSAELEAEIIERAHTRPIESVMDADRRWLAEQQARFAEQRRRDAERKAETMPDATQEALEACARAIDALDRENAALRERVDALEKKQAGDSDVGKLSAGLDRLDAMADKLAKTLSQFSRARLDSLPLPLPPAHLNN
jgi:hypothetical protein